jgi:prenyltransferase beta subunit
MNITLMPYVCYGFWVNVGAAFLSLVMRYHLKMYYNELKKIRAFILLMS